MRIVIWIFLFYFVSSLSTYIMIARGEQSRMMWINGSIAIVNIIGNLLVIPWYSFIGSAWVTLVTQILLMIITWWYVRDTIHIKKSIFFVFFMSIISLISLWVSKYSITILNIQDMNLKSIVLRFIIAGIVFVFIYLIGWWLIRKKTI